MTFTLNNGTFKPYEKPNDLLLYIKKVTTNNKTTSQNNQQQTFQNHQRQTFEKFL